MAQPWRWLFSRMFDVRLPNWLENVRERIAVLFPESWFDQCDETPAQMVARRLREVRLG
jgi:hypothetical protein